MFGTSFFDIVFLDGILHPGSNSEIRDLKELNYKTG
jgi:hypothetical protein